jgi:hypothetical protein
MQLHDKGVYAVCSCMADSNPSRNVAARHLSELVISQYHREYGIASDTRDSSRIEF